MTPTLMTEIMKELDDELKMLVKNDNNVFDKKNKKSKFIKDKFKLPITVYKFRKVSKEFEDQILKKLFPKINKQLKNLDILSFDSLNIDSLLFLKSLDADQINLNIKSFDYKSYSKDFYALHFKFQLIIEGLVEDCFRYNLIAIKKKIKDFNKQRKDQIYYFLEHILIQYKNEYDYINIVNLEKQFLDYKLKLYNSLDLKHNKIYKKFYKLIYKIFYKFCYALKAILFKGIEWFFLKYLHFFVNILSLERIFFLRRILINYKEKLLLKYIMKSDILETSAKGVIYNNRVLFKKKHKAYFWIDEKQLLGKYLIYELYYTIFLDSFIKKKIKILYSIKKKKCGIFHFISFDKTIVMRVLRKDLDLKLLVIVFLKKLKKSLEKYEKLYNKLSSFLFFIEKDILLLMAMKKNDILLEDFIEDAIVVLKQLIKQLDKKVKKLKKKYEILYLSLEKFLKEDYEILKYIKLNDNQQKVFLNKRNFLYKYPIRIFVKDFFKTDKNFLMLEKKQKKKNKIQLIKNAQYQARKRYKNMILDIDNNFDSENFLPYSFNYFKKLKNIKKKSKL